MVLNGAVKMLKELNSDKKSSESVLQEYKTNLFTSSFTHLFYILSHFIISYYIHLINFLSVVQPIVFILFYQVLPLKDYLCQQVL